MNAPADPRRRATRYAWTLLVTATILSVAGNVATAVDGGHGTEAVAVAVVVPLMLAATVHLLALMVRAGVAGWAYRGVMALTVVIAGSAFTLSFDALAALATRTGHGALSPLLPVMIDATIAAATAALVVLDRPVATNMATEPVTGGQEVATAPATHPVTPPVPAPVTAAGGHPVAGPVAGGAGPVAGGHLVAVSPLTSDDAPEGEHRARAEELVAAGVVRADPATVATALAGLATGDSQRAVAAATGLHRVTVGRLAEVV